MENTLLSRRQLLSNIGLGAAVVAAPGLSAAPTPATPPGARSLNVRDFGAAGDGVKDDTAAFQAALKAAAEGDCLTVYVPRGHYMIATRLTIPANVTLEGVFVTPAVRSHAEGSVLLAVADAGQEEGEPFLMMHGSSTLRGITVYYPSQKMTAEPVPYPWTVRGSGDNICLQNVLLVNPFQAVDFGTLPCGRHSINGLYAQPIHRGLFIDQCFDVGRVENVHFWSFWGGWDGALYKYMAANSVAFILAKSDWEFMSNCFCIGHKIGYHFVNRKAGPGNYLLLNSGSDIGPTSVRVEESQPHAGNSFTNCQFMSGIETAPTNRGPLKFNGCGFWGTPQTAQHALLEGSGHVFFTACHFIDWARRDPQAPAIHARRGGLTVSGCDFMDGGKAQIVVEPEVAAALIYGNRLRGAERITNHAGEKTKLALNIVTP